MNDFERLRTMYPRPSCGWAENANPPEGSYCVGGAFMQFVKFETWGCLHFPGPVTLARALRQYNPRLPNDQARIFATTIILTNDDEDYGSAWEALYQAMTYGG